ncbi:MAG: hypothetical protein G01um101491_233 [Parcubacteria group bacterium Gr01-1014_91]|nr:MAG: hypothetical protein G01um101491_233 [Parcubacteria group bacterium Gr01-1014_91]
METESEGTKTLGWWILEALRRGESLTIPAADAEAIRQRYTASVTPKLAELRKRQHWSPTPEMYDLRLN